MAWRTRSSGRGFGGSGGSLSWHTHGTRPPAGSVEWWPKGLASRMAMSRVLQGTIRDRHQVPQLPQSDTPDGLHWSRGRTCGWLPQALATGGPHGGRQITISKWNPSSLSPCRWLGALAINQGTFERCVRHPETACFSRVTLEGDLSPRAM